MAMALDTATMAQDFARDGAFSSIRTYVERGDIDAATASAYTAQVFGMYKLKIAEGRKELQRLGAVLDRLEAIAATASHKRPYSPRDPQVLALAHEIVAFDGWVMSLYETDLSMIWWGAPERGRDKPKEMAKAMGDLFDKRLREMQFNLRDTSLFRLA
jgi:hypothetical protein